MLDIPKFETDKELYDFLVTNKESLIAQKCSAVKFADGFGADVKLVSERSFVGKSIANDNENEIKVKAIINTTNILDSHGDVHIKGIWNKSIKENKRILHIQEHKSNEFSKIISSGDDLSVSVKEYTWKELGYEADGTTQALVFDSTVKRERNKYMFDQYKSGYVDNHSVGMRYVKMSMAINSEDYPEEKEIWDKHIGEIVNRDEAERKNYFWAIYEAKAIEGSAVPNGSNPVTPTLSNKEDITIVDTEKMKAMKAFLNK